MVSYQPPVPSNYLPAERMSEIQYQNRVLLRKMLQIDLKAQQKKDHHQAMATKDAPNPSALNQYNSLNRQTRIRELARIVDDNK